MMQDTPQRRLKRIVIGLIVLFVLIFVTSLIPGDRVLFLLPALFYVGLAAVLIVITLTSHVKGPLRVLLLLAGLSSVVFSAGLVYGVLGIRGYYAINDPLYLTSVMGSWVGFAIGVVGSIVLFRKASAR